jgi:hypothetical protein
MTRTPRPAPSPASPTTPPPVTVATSFKIQLRHIFTRPLQHATPPVVDVPFAQGLQVRPVEFYDLSWMSDAHIYSVMLREVLKISMMT